jgi:hypothetical protein
MAIPIGESIVIGSGLFATMGVIIKAMTVKAHKNGKNSNGKDAQNGVPPGVSHKTLDQILDNKLRKLVTDPVCLARYQGLERHVTDIFESVGKQLDTFAATQEKIFDKLDEIKKCQIDVLSKAIK